MKHINFADLRVFLAIADTGNLTRAAAHCCITPSAASVRLKHLEEEAGCSLEAKYGGAAPPPGDGMHRYVFTVWALPVEKLALTPESNCPTAGFLLHREALAKATLTATYVTA